MQSLHAMDILQVYQDELLRELHKGSPGPSLMQELHHCASSGSGDARPASSTIADDSVARSRSKVGASVPLWPWSLHQDAMSRHVVVITDVSSTGWGTVCNGQAVSGPWTGPRLRCHIYCLELLGCTAGLQRFPPLIQHKHVLVRMHKTAIVAYINCQGGIRSCDISQLAHHLFLCSQQ